MGHLRFNRDRRDINGVLAMVKNVTSLTGNGLRDWIIQRVTWVIIAVYVVFLVTFMAVHAPLTHDVWCQLFRNNLMRLATVLTLLAILLHMYIIMWTIFTDYLKNTLVRVTAEVVVFISLLAFVIWGVMILWGS